MEDVELEDDEDEEDGNALEEGDCLNNVQIAQEQSMSTLLEMMDGENTLLAGQEMEMATSSCSTAGICQPNYGLEIEEEDVEENLNKFKLPTEIISTISSEPRAIRM